MLKISIPDYGDLQIEHLALDYNGTLAVDGLLIDGVAERLNRLAGQMLVHIITADTFGRAKAGLADVDCTLTILPPDNQPQAKRRYVQLLGATGVAAVGNGRNDALMLQAAKVGIAVIEGEGAAPAAVQAADVLAPNIMAALDLLLNPLRLKATLRA